MAMAIPGGPSQAAPAREAADDRRERWIDAARGISITLVVAGHNPGLWSQFPEFANLLASFRMPLFFAIVGTTMLGRPTLRSTLLRVAALLISYTVLCLLSLPLALRHEAYQSLGQVLLGILYGTGHTIVIVPLWFLPCLAVALLVAHAIDALVARLLPRVSPGSEALSAALALAVGLGVLALQGPLALQFRLGWGDVAHSGALLNLDLAGFGAGFIFVGRALRGIIQGHDDTGRWHLKMAIAATLVFALLYVVFHPRLDLNLRLAQPGAAAMLVATAGCTAAMFIIFLLRHTLLARLSAALGSMTLVILWLHAGIEKRAWEGLSGVLPAPVALLLSIAVAVLVPYGIDRLLTFVPRLRVFIYPHPVLARLKKGRKPPAVGVVATT
jgi:fucose 4-O-acetylase-like acetyltransferase